MSDLYRLKRGPVHGRIRAPPSKSHFIRAVSVACLAEGTTLIARPSRCADARSALRVATAIGVEVGGEPDAISLRSPAGPFPHGARSGCLHVGESALTLRLFAPIIGLSRTRYRMEISGSLRRRPIGALASVLGQLGVECITEAEFAMISVRGPWHRERVEVDGSLTSQVISGLLVAGAANPRGVNIDAPVLYSRGYVDLTRSVLSEAGIFVHQEDERGHTRFQVPGGQAIRPLHIAIEGDWSSAAFYLVAGAIGGVVTVSGLDLASCQPDRVVLEALDSVGAIVEREDDSICVKRANLRAFTFDVADCPDLAPPLVALAACCEGVSSLRGTRRLAAKESPRERSLADAFGAVGVRIDVESDVLRIHGGHISSGVVDPANDHRVAMAVSVAALRSTGTVLLLDPKCVEKSDPDFLAALFRLVD